MAHGKQAVVARKRSQVANPRRCGLCGKTRKLIQTECCGKWICDDEDTYVLFSYERNSCHRNHSRYTLCALHHTEKHPGRWMECRRCRDDIAETQMYVWYGTNEYNFEKLKNPPSYEPTHCSKCKKIINLGEDGYSMFGDKYSCEACAGFA